MSGTELALLSLATPLAVEASTVAYRIVYGLLASVNEIASRLWVSRETVHTHVTDIQRKLEAHSRSEAVARARLASTTWCTNRSRVVALMKR